MFRAMEEPLSLLTTIAASSALALLILAIMGIFGGANNFPVEGKTVLVTGASEGTGFVICKKFAARGANVVAVARNAEKLQNLVQEMQAAAKNPGKQRFTYLTADVSVPDYATALIDEATRWNNNQTLDVVWAVAGFANPRLLMDSDVDSVRKHMAVNFYGAVELAQAICKVWLAPDAPVEKQPKHIIFTISLAVFSPVPGFGPYGPAKSALRYYADTLATEVQLYPQNVKVSVCVPGGIDTEGMVRENLTKPGITRVMEATDPIQTPEVVANAFFKGLERGQYFITCHWLSWLALCSAFGSSYRNNWFLDGIGTWISAVAWFFVRWDMDSQIHKYGKEHGHPAFYEKNGA